MAEIYACTALVCVVSLLTGRALLAALGQRGWTWLEGAIGLALLTVAASLAVRLPGRVTSAAIAIAIVALASLAFLARARGLGLSRHSLAAGIPAALIVLALTAIPFALSGRAGVLGEGVYSNDHAVHLYWAEWLQHGVGPEPRGIGWGYPVGPHSLVAALSAATGASPETAFNALLIAIPVLAALASLALLETLPAVRRAGAAALVGLPYLGAAFLAQSSFKETAVGLYLLAFALALRLIDRAESHGPALAAMLALPVVAAAVTLSLPALGWFLLAGAIWVVASPLSGQGRLSREILLARLRSALPLIAVAIVLLALVAILQHDALVRFGDRLGEVRDTTGRLLERQPPWQVLGVWPEGDFRLGAGLVDGAAVAIALGLVALAVAVATMARRREPGLLATLAAAAGVYAYTLAVGGIHVQAKALAVAAPLVALVVFAALLSPGGGWRLRLGVVFALAAAASVLLALREAPVGSTDRARELEALSERVGGGEVAFLALDRFAPYRLRGAELVRSPGGYVPAPLHARRAKRWEQGRALDFDTVSGGRLGRFDFAITTAASFSSSAPEGFEPVARSESFVLWERTGPVELREVLGREGDRPGSTFRCDAAPRLGGAGGTAGVLPRPVVRRFEAWRPTPEFVAPGDASVRLSLPRGRWLLSIQYNSEVPLRLSGPGVAETLPVALEGMYAYAPGRGSFWPAGELKSDGGGVRVDLKATEPNALERVVRARRRVWLGRIAAVRARAVPTAKPEETADVGPGPPVATRVPLSRACGKYVDWYQLSR